MTPFGARIAEAGLVARIYRAVEPAYPEEGCGFLFESAAGDLLFLPTENRAALLHRKDPERYPRAGGDWFEPDMKPWLRATRDGAEPRLIFHSHPDSDAYFSPSDREQARYRTEEGVLLERNPGVLHLVVSVRGGRAARAALFAWDASSSDFVEVGAFDADGAPVA